MNSGLGKDLVCPRCGAVAAEHQYCQTCGLHLWELDELPARSDWVSLNQAANLGEPSDTEQTWRWRGRSVRPRIPRNVVLVGLLAMCAVLAAAGAVIYVTATPSTDSALGGDEDAAHLMFEGHSDEASSAGYIDCIDAWNRSASQVKYLAAAYRADAAGVVSFAGSECGVVFAISETEEAYGLNAFVDRGDDFSPFIDTQLGSGTREGIAEGQVLASLALSDPNAAVEGVELIPLSGADVHRLEITAEPKSSAIHDVDGKDASDRQLYAVDWETWSTYSRELAIKALARFFLDHDSQCNREDAAHVASQVRDGAFEFEGSLQVALHEACATEGPGSEGLDSVMAVDPEVWLDYSRERRLEITELFLDVEGCPIEPEVTPEAFLSIFDGTVATEAEQTGRFRSNVLEAARFLCSEK